MSHWDTKLAISVKYIILSGPIQISRGHDNCFIQDYIYIYIYIYIYTHTHTYIYIYIYVCMYIYNIHIYTYIHMHILYGNT